VNVLTTVNPLRGYLAMAGALLIAGLLAFSHFTAYRAGRAAVRAQWDAANVAQERAIQEQAARNRDLQRAAELRYTVTAQAREVFITRTTQEVRRASKSLAACPVPVDAVRLLNAAAACARGDPAAACGAGDGVPGAGQPGR
jgi:hypothetical protein